MTWSASANEAGYDLETVVDLAPKDDGPYTFDVIRAVLAYQAMLRTQGASTQQLRAAVQALDTLATESATNPGLWTSGVQAAAEIRRLSPPTWADMMGAIRPPNLKGGGLGGPEGLRGGTEGAALMDPRVGYTPTEDQRIYWKAGEFSGKPLDLPPDEGPRGSTSMYGLAQFLFGLSNGLVLLPHIRWSGALDMVPLDRSWATPGSPAPPRRPRRDGDTSATPPTVTPSIFLIEDFELVLTPHGPEDDAIVTSVAVLPAESRDYRLASWRDLEPVRAAHVADSLSTYAAELLERGILGATGSNATAVPPERGWLDVYASEGRGRRIVQVDDLPDLSFSGGMAQHLRRASFGQSIMGALTLSADRANMYRHGLGSGAPGEAGEARSFGNVNMRNTLTFRFVSQARKFDAEVILKEIRVGFSNGRMSSWRQSPLVDLHPFLDALLAGGNAALENQLIDLASGAAGEDGRVTETLDRLEGDRAGFASSLFDPASPTEGLGPTGIGYAHRAYRWRPGLRHPVASGTFRLVADYVSVDPILGTKDALDPYAKGLQDVDLKDRETLIQQREVLTKALGEIPDPETRAASYATALSPDNTFRLAVDQQ